MEIEITLKEAVQELMINTGDTGVVDIFTVTRNNSRKQTGFAITYKQATPAPVFYIDEHLTLIKNSEITINEAAKMVYTQYKSLIEEVTHPMAEQELNLNKESILQRAVYFTVNKDLNQNKIQEVPYIELYDLVTMFQVIVYRDDKSVATILITNLMMGMYQITKEELIKAAHDNTIRRGVNLKSMFETMLDSIIPEDIARDLFLPNEDVILERENIWVITNDVEQGGASILMLEEELGKIADKLQADLYLLPSSIHELVAVKKRSPDKPHEIERLKHMVAEVNETVVMPDDILSNSVYLYDRESRKVTLVF